MHNDHAKKMDVVGANRNGRDTGYAKPPNVQ